MLIVNTARVVVTVMAEGARAVLSRRDCLCGSLNLNTQNCQRELPDLITRKNWNRVHSLALWLFQVFPSQAEHIIADGCFFNKNHVGLSILNALIMCNGKHGAKCIVIKNMKTREQFPESLVTVASQNT